MHEPNREKSHAKLRVARDLIWLIEEASTGRSDSQALADDAARYAELPHDTPTSREQIVEVEDNYGWHWGTIPIRCWCARMFPVRMGVPEAGPTWGKAVQLFIVHKKDRRRTLTGSLLLRVVQEQSGG